MGIGTHHSFQQPIKTESERTLKAHKLRTVWRWNSKRTQFYRDLKLYQKIGRPRCIQEEFVETQNA